MWHHTNAAQRDADHFHQCAGFLAQHARSRCSSRRSLRTIDRRTTMPCCDPDARCSRVRCVCVPPLRAPQVLGPDARLEPRRDGRGGVRVGLGAVDARLVRQLRQPRERLGARRRRDELDLALTPAARARGRSRTGASRSSRRARTTAAPARARARAAAAARAARAEQRALPVARAPRARVRGCCARRGARPLGRTSCATRARRRLPDCATHRAFALDAVPKGANASAGETQYVGATLWDLATWMCAARARARARASARARRIYAADSAPILGT